MILCHKMTETTGNFALNEIEVIRMLDHKTILVTGGTGSFGTNLSNLRLKISKLKN